jgi:hypothetical protein
MSAYVSIRCPPPVSLSVCPYTGTDLKVRAGTALYAAPEQMDGGEVAGSADIFRLSHSLPPPSLSHFLSLSYSLSLLPPSPPPSSLSLSLSDGGECLHAVSNVLKSCTNRHYVSFSSVEIVTDMRRRLRMFYGCFTDALPYAASASS